MKNQTSNLKELTTIYLVLRHFTSSDKEVEI
jgi:hypothetical protein